MYRLILSLWLLLLPLTTTHASTVPRIVVSIAPLHSLVTGVISGVGTAELLISGNASPHGIMLKPSQIVALQRADVIIWTGEAIEAFLPRVLATLTPGKRIIKVMSLPAIKRLATRNGGLWPEEDDHDGHGHIHDETDGHLWLDPDNARIIIEQICKDLAQIDPSNAVAYRANTETVKQRLVDLDHELQHLLTPVKDVPYLVFHDAYQYLEQRYHLSPVGAIMVDPEHKPGARRLAEIHARINSQNVRCVFSEPQFSKKLPDILIAGTRSQSATVDPLGLAIPVGEDLYFEMMYRLGRDLSACLATK